MERFTPAGVDGAYSPAVAETHSGVVFFVGDRAFKLKKALDLGFVDFRTVEQRRVACEREVALNSRLARDVYLGVADVHGSDGEVCDHLVVMRRMPADRSLARLVRNGEPVEAVLDDLARLLAEFHARAARSPEADAAASPDALRQRWRDNTMGMRPFAGRFFDETDIDTVDSLADRYLRGRRRLINARIASGHACDGHGDLLADDIFCLEDGPRVLDCLEFDDALRLEDVLADVAFLAMDLERLGRPDLADRFLAGYRHESGDDWPMSLAHHHIAYRAQVRAKVTAIRAQQGTQDAATEARRLLELAKTHLEAGRVRLILVGGLPGTGKSTLSRGIAETTGALVLRSDVIRKELAGLGPEQRAGASFGEGIYDEATTSATYAEVLSRAEDALEMGRTVVLDASWTSEDQRAKARLVAERTYSDLVELRCVAPSEVVRARIAARSAVGTDASDADATISAAMAGVADPWPSSTAVDTSAELAVVVQSALEVVGPM